MAMFTREYGSTARPGNRIATIVILENRSFMPDTVNIRSRCHFPYRMTINTHSLTGMVITHNKDDIGAFVTDFLFLALHNGGRHKGKTTSPKDNLEVMALSNCQISQNRRMVG